MIPLFEQFPALAELPIARFASLPSPVEPWSGVTAQIGGAPLWIKRDDQSGTLYGGNKVRKLEFLLAAARAAGAGEVLTFGAAGSNHALATAIYARELGFGSHSMLVPQINSHTVRRNLLWSHYAGAHLHHYANERRMGAAVRYQRLRALTQDGSEPYVIPGGGSSAVGCLGFVNAACELAAQVRAGELPEPDFIYLPLGTTGTAAGLAFGLRAAGLRSRLVTVRVVRDDIGNLSRFRRLCRQIAALLSRYDPALGAIVPPDPVIRHDYYGGQYALYTPAALAAVSMAQESSGISLEPTYTGKACAALFADLGSGALGDAKVLYWDTYNARPPPAALASADYRALPAGVHRYFEQDVQPLDRHTT